MSCNIKRELKWLKNYLLFWKERINAPKEHVWLVGTPVYGNLGDQAIALGITQFWTECGGQDQIIEIPSQYMRVHTNLFKPLIGKDVIWITGGGFMGSLWPQEEKMIEYVLTNFPDNKICVLPQTLYFTDDIQGEEDRKRFVKVCEGHKNLWLFFREETSYLLAERLLPNAKIFLAPDMALSMRPKYKKYKKKDILLCLRNDKEKKIQETDIEIIKNAIHNFYPDETVIVTDTVLKKNVWKNEREYEVYAKIQQFAEAKLIITDRLHGMVFAALAGTPCVVCGNINHKVKGIYQWIKNNRYIYFADNKEELVEGIRILSQYDINNIVFDRTFYENHYEELKQVLMINDER